MRQLNYRRALSAVVLLACLSPTPYLHAQENQDEDFDAYKLRVDARWYYSNPTGTLHGANDSDSIDLNKDLHFQNYSTFSGKLDWKFTRKNHLYLVLHSAVCLAPDSTEPNVHLSGTDIRRGIDFEQLAGYLGGGAWIQVRHLPKEAVESGHWGSV